MIPALPAVTVPVALHVDSALKHIARRANLEDLPALLRLWEKSNLPGVQLEKYLTEFQVIDAPEGGLLAAIGLQIDGDEALVHSEAIATEAEADACRLGLWTRMQIVVRNQGIQRVWTLEDADYWRGLFKPASREEIAGLKASFADPTASWYRVRFLDENQVNKLVNQQVLLRGGSLEGDRAELAEAIRRAKIIAYSIATGVIILLVVFALYMLIHREELQRAIKSR